MNPQFHQEFVALCALFFTGELTDEEWALLQVHLAYCDTCRTTFEEYKQLHRNVIPAMAAADSGVAESVKESDRDFEEAEKRLLESLEGPGHPHRRPPLPNRSRTIAFGLIAAGAAAAAVFGYFRMGHTGIKQPVVIQAVASPSVQPVLRHPASSDQALQHDLDESQREV
ncbi:MAG: hypothetical protein JF563_02755, partial [Acidobacteriales bacterium]|nr:hypothetical protein [Terriglobales bacterium]